MFAERIPEHRWPAGWRKGSGRGHTAAMSAGPGAGGACGCPTPSCPASAPPAAPGTHIGLGISQCPHNMHRPKLSSGSASYILIGLGHILETSRRTSPFPSSASRLAHQNCSANAACAWCRQPQALPLQQHLFAFLFGKVKHHKV